MTKALLCRVDQHSHGRSENHEINLQKETESTTNPTCVITSTDDGKTWFTIIPPS